MAIANPTLLTAAGYSAGGTTSVTTTSISPTADALLVFLVAVYDAGSTSANTVLTSTSLQSTFAGAGAWTEIQPHAETTHLSWMVAYQQMGSAPGAGTIRANLADSTGVQVAYIAAELIGVAAAAPIAESTWQDFSTGPIVCNITDMLLGNLLVSFAAGLSASANTTGAGLVTVGVANSNGTPGVVANMTYDPNDTRISVSKDNNADNMQLSQILVEFAQSYPSAAPTGYSAGTNRGSRGRTRFGSR